MWITSQSNEVIDFARQGEILLEHQILPQFEIGCMINCDAFRLESPSLDQKCNTVKIPIGFVIDEP